MITAELDPPTPRGPQHKDALDDAEKLRRRQRAGEMSAIFGGLDRLVTLLRVYPMSHPLVDGFAQQLAQRADALIQSHGPMVVKIGAIELRTEWGERFFSQENSERDHFIWFQPFSDGLATLTFEHGVTAQELQRLMMIINRADLRKLPPDDDAVTMLWEASLAHIQADSLDGFVDAGEGAILGELTEPQARELVVHASIAPNSQAATRLVTLTRSFPASPVDAFTRHHAKDAISVVSKTRDAEEMAEALRVDPAWMDRLMAEWTAGADLEYRLVEALLSLIRTSPGSPIAARAADTIVQLTTQLFAANAWPSVISLLKLLRSRQSLFTGDDDPLTALLALASDPLQLETLIFLCQTSDEPTRRQLIELLGLLDHALVQRQLLRSLADEKKELRSLDALITLLASVTDSQRMTDWYTAELLANTTYLTRMTQGLRGRELGDMARAAAHLFVAALKSPIVTLRRDALLAYNAEWGSQTILERDVEPMMSDSDELIRQHAMDLLRRERPQSFLSRLDAIIDRADFAHRPPGELRFLLKHYLELRPDAAPRLRALLNTRGWFSAEARAVAASVARLLIERGDEPAIALVRARAASLLVAPKLRQDYSRALERAGLIAHDTHTAKPS